MPQTQILDTLAIADRLGELRRKLRICGLACVGLEDSNGAIIAQSFHEIESETEAVSKLVHPVSPLVRQVASVRHEAERSVAELFED